MILLTAVSAQDMNSMNYVDICAVIVSVCAFFISVYTAYLQRQHNRLSVKPLIDIVIVDKTTELCIEIHNNGMGPMIIENIEFKKGDEKHSRCIKGLLQGVASKFHYVKQLDTLIIPANEKLELVTIEFVDKKEIEVIINTLKESEMQIAYMDIYGKRKLYKTGIMKEWF